MVDMSASTTDRRHSAWLRWVTRWVVAVLAIVHGLIHLLGASKGLGWADVDQLSEPIGTVGGVTWLAAAVVVVIAGILLAVRAAWWWAVGLVAVVVSQGLIVSAWNDAWAGTIANVVVFVAALHGLAAHGPKSSRAVFRSAVESAGTRAAPGGVVTNADLGHLPEPVATYVRRSGAVGQPRIASFRARISGRIRSGPTAPWMHFVGEQVNTYGTDLSRVFFMDATMKGLPVDVLHTFVGSTATMRVKLLSVITMVDAAGPDMDRAETVTLFNDMCLLAPAALADAPVTWRPIDDRRVSGTFTHGDHTVSAALVFDEAGDLVDFVSDDRLRASNDGVTFTLQRWSTPWCGYRQFDFRRVGAAGEGRWHAPDPEGEFVYLEFRLDDIAYNERISDRPLERPASTQQLTALTSAHWL